MTPQLDRAEAFRLIADAHARIAEAEDRLVALLRLPRGSANLEIEELGFRIRRDQQVILDLESAILDRSVLR
jgi:hypothetical protein